MANLQSDVVDRMAIVGKVFAELELYKGLTYNISFGGDYYGSHNDQYRSSELPLLGQKYYDVKSNPTATVHQVFISTGWWRIKSIITQRLKMLILSMWS